MRDRQGGIKMKFNEVADKKPHHHLAKGFLIGVVAPAVTIALLVKHHKKSN